MADTAVLLEIITYIFQRTPPTADCDEPLITVKLNHFNFKAILVFTLIGNLNGMFNYFYRSSHTGLPIEDG